MNYQTSSLLDFASDYSRIVASGSCVLLGLEAQLMEISQLSLVSLSESVLSLLSLSERTQMVCLSLDRIFLKLFFRKWSNFILEMAFFSSSNSLTISALLFPLALPIISSVQKSSSSSGSGHDSNPNMVQPVSSSPLFTHRSWKQWSVMAFRRCSSSLSESWQSLTTNEFWLSSRELDSSESFRSTSSAQNSSYSSSESISQLTLAQRSKGEVQSIVEGFLIKQPQQEKKNYLLQMQTGWPYGEGCVIAFYAFLFLSQNYCLSSGIVIGLPLSDFLGDLDMLILCDLRYFLSSSRRASKAAYSVFSMSLEGLLVVDFLHLKLQLMRVLSFCSLGLRKRKRFFLALRMPFELSPSASPTRRSSTSSTKAKYSSSDRFSFRNSSSIFTRSSSKGFDRSISLQIPLRFARYFFASAFFLRRWLAASGSRPRKRSQKELTSQTDSSGWQVTQAARSVTFFCQNLVVPPISSTSRLASSMTLMFLRPAMDWTQTSRKFSSSSQVQLQRRYSLSSSSLASQEEEGSICMDSHSSFITFLAFFSQVTRSYRHDCSACSWGVISIQIIYTLL